VGVEQFRQELQLESDDQISAVCAACKINIVQGDAGYVVQLPTRKVELSEP